MSRGFHELQADQTETSAALQSRTRISDVLRAQVMPFTEAQLSGMKITAVDFQEALKR